MNIDDGAQRIESATSNPIWQPATVMKNCKWHISEVHHSIPFMYERPSYFAVGLYIIVDAYDWQGC